MITLAQLLTLSGILFALAVRLPYVLSSDFPLNDGGMFVAMSRDLLANHFILPGETKRIVDEIEAALALRVPQINTAAVREQDLLAIVGGQQQLLLGAHDGSQAHAPMTSVPYSSF